jgi:hypothetical protein
VKVFSAIGLLIAAAVAAAVLSTGAAAAQSSRDARALPRCSNNTLRGTASIRFAAIQIFAAFVPSAREHAQSEALRCGTD